MATLALAWCVLGALTARNPHMAMAMAMAEKQEKKLILARTKAQERLLLFWVGFVCPMGGLYDPTGTLCL
jgi:hypothetical protein